MAEAIHSVRGNVRYIQWVVAEFSGLNGDQVKCLEEFDTENARLF